MEKDNVSMQLIKRIIEPKQQIPEDRKRFSNAELKNLIYPIIIEQFLALLVGIADTLMVGAVWAGQRHLCLNFDYGKIVCVG